MANQSIKHNHLDFSFIDKIGKDTCGLIIVNVLFTHQPKRFVQFSNNFQNNSKSFVHCLYVHTNTDYYWEGVASILWPRHFSYPISMNSTNPTWHVHRLIVDINVRWIYLSLFNYNPEFVNYLRAVVKASIEIWWVFINRDTLIEWMDWY